MTFIFFIESRGILDTVLIENLAETVKKWLEAEYGTPAPLPVITCATSLAHNGLLGSVERMWLRDVDLTSVPAEHLASLFSSVTGVVTIINVSGSDGLVAILDSVKSNSLNIISQSLGREETQALVRAMESGVEEIRLNKDVTLDIRDLIEYNGHGKCEEVWCYYDTADRYREQLRTWATSRNWEVTCDDSIFRLFDCSKMYKYI